MAKRGRQSNATGSRKKVKYSTMAGYKARANRKGKRVNFKKAASRSRSSTFTQKVQRVLSKNTPTGTYTKTYTGNLPNLNDNGYTFHSQISRESVPLAGSDFLFFDTRKIMDAVSILYNAKSADMNSYLTPGNMGVETTKFRLQYASVKVNVKNITDIAWDVEFWAIDNKHQDTSTFANDYAAALTNLNTVGPAATISTIGVEPSQIPQLAKNYNMKRTKRTLQSGQSFSYFTSISDRIIDFIQYFEGTETQFFQKFSKQLIMRFKPSLSVSYNATNANVGYYSGSSGSFDHPFMVEVTEKYKLDCPEDVATDKEKDVWAWFTDIPDRILADSPAIRTVQNINFREANTAQKTF